jgi:hypothetical protein
LTLANGELVGTDGCFPEMVVLFFALCLFSMIDSNLYQYCFVRMKNQHQWMLYPPQSHASAMVTGHDAFVASI